MQLVRLKSRVHSVGDILAALTLGIVLLGAAEVAAQQRQQPDGAANGSAHRADESAAASSREMSRSAESEQTSESDESESVEQPKTISSQPPDPTLTVVEGGEGPAALQAEPKTEPAAEPSAIGAQAVEAPASASPTGRGRLGFRYRDVDAEARLRMRLGDRSGLLVVAVAAEGPAHDAGMREGDIIVAAEGIPFASARAFHAWSERLPPGLLVPVSIWRVGRELETALRVGQQAGHRGDQQPSADPADAPVFSLGAGLGDPGLSTLVAVFDNSFGAPPTVVSAPEMRLFAEFLLSRRSAFVFQASAIVDSQHHETKSSDSTVDLREFSLAVGIRYVTNPGGVVELSHYVLLEYGWIELEQTYESRTGSSSSSMRLSTHRAGAGGGLALERRLIDNLYLRLSALVIEATYQLGSFEGDSFRTGIYRDDPRKDKVTDRTVALTFEPAIELRMTF